MICAMWPPHYSRSRLVAPPFGREKTKVSVFYLEYRTYVRSWATVVHTTPYIIPLPRRQVTPAQLARLSALSPCPSQRMICAFQSGAFPFGRQTSIRTYCFCCSFFILRLSSLSLKNTTSTVVQHWGRKRKSAVTYPEWGWRWRTARARQTTKWRDSPYNSAVRYSGGGADPRCLPTGLVRHVVELA